MEPVYKPRGKVAKVLELVAEDPSRIWTRVEMGELMGCAPGAVISMLTYAMQAGLIRRGKGADGLTAFSGMPFAEGGLPPPPEKLNRIAHRARANGWATDPDDLRIQRVVPGWRPPVMVAPRGEA